MKPTSPLRHFAFLAFLRPLGLMVVVSVVAGLLVAAIALPVVAGFGVVAKTGATDWDSLPSSLQRSPLPVRSKILASDGSLLGEFDSQNRIAVTIDQIPDVTKLALLAIEDSRFYLHHGIDFEGSLRALISNLRGGSLQGGSTLTQQYVKNMLEYDAADAAQAAAAKETTIERKIREARYALTLDRELTKDQILEGYFNIAYFGEGAYGIGAAAQHYFGVPVQQLTLDESAMLVGLVQNPSAHDPVRHPTNARNRRDTVLGRMVTVGFISQAQEQAAAEQPLRLHVTKQTFGCQADKAPYFCEWVVQSLINDPTFGATAQDRKDALFQGGLTIRTTLNWKDEQAAEAALAAHLPADKAHNPRGIAGAEVVLDPKTGAVLAMTANQPWGLNKGQNVNLYPVGASSGFQGGSTFKLFTMITALEQGVPITQVFNSPYRYYSTVFPGYDKAHKGVTNSGDSEAGVFDMTQATAHSVNTYFVQLEEKVGVLPIVATARTMGVDPNKFDKDPVTPVEGSFTLGTREVSPLEMAGAYATVANHGKFCTPYALASVTNGDGTNRPVQGQNCRQVIPETVADTATELLTHVITDPGATGFANGNIGRPAAGKTGTTNSYGAAWFDGFTPDLVASVWIGDPAGPNHLGGLTNLTINGTVWKQIYGGDIPTMIWHDTMMAALAGTPPTNFLGTPVSSAPNTSFVLVPKVVGLPSAVAGAALNHIGLVPSIAKVAVVSPLPAGQVLSSVPAQGARVASGSTVVLTVSSGLSPSPTLSPSPAVSKGKPATLPPPPAVTTTPVAATTTVAPPVPTSAAAVVTPPPAILPSAPKSPGT